MRKQFSAETMERLERGREGKKSATEGKDEPNNGCTRNEIPCELRAKCRRGALYVSIGAVSRLNETSCGVVYPYYRNPSRYLPTPLITKKAPRPHRRAGELCITYLRIPFTLAAEKA